MEFPILLLYALLGGVGGVIYVLAPPQTDTKPDAIKQIILGLIVGFIAYVILSTSDPSKLADRTTYLAVIGLGYTAQDFLKKLFNPGSGGGGGIPIGTRCVECK